MKNENEAPQWVREARAAWPKESTDIDPKWIKRFLGYLESRNGGRLPETAPGYGMADAFVRFLKSNWNVDDREADQASKAAEWLLSVASSSLDTTVEDDGAPIPYRSEVEYEIREFASLRSVRSFSLPTRAGLTW